MKAIWRIFRYIHLPGIVWLLVYFGAMLAICGYGDVRGSASFMAWMIGILCANVSTGRNNTWEQMAIILPISRWKIMLEKYAACVGAAILAAACFGAGSLAGRGTVHLGFVLVLIGYSIQMSAIRIPMFLYFGEEYKLKQILFYVGTMLLKNWLPHGEYISVPAEGGMTELQLDVPLEAGLIMLASAMVLCIGSYYLSLFLDKRREW